MYRKKRFVVNCKYKFRFGREIRGIERDLVFICGKIVNEVVLNNIIFLGEFILLIF